MNRHVNSIAGRLSLRPPQRESLEILSRVAEVSRPSKEADLAAALSVIQSEYLHFREFDRDFPSLCFALATGVGKTRLMGAFITYLHLAHGINNFFVLAPNLTIYNKLIADFTPNTSKYVFKGIAEFATETPEIITGDNYETRAGDMLDSLVSCKINIFNISKIIGRRKDTRKMHRLSEYIGESYFEYLAAKDDLVVLMDESHRYRAQAGMEAINDLKPVLGLELTATPFTLRQNRPVPFGNVVYDYPLAKAIQDGFVKRPAVVTQKNFDPSQFDAEQLEKIKLQDGVSLHERVKVELQTYATSTGEKKVKPFVLVIARDTTHAAELQSYLQSEDFFEGRYNGKVIQVDSSNTSGSEGDEIVQRLLAVEDPEEPTEIVIHVYMLKEGWDVTNLYTIVPLNAANSRTLIEQSIGRGLRLPYGKRTGVKAVDRLNIVAHDKFEEIVEEANRGDSIIQLEKLVLDPDDDLGPTKSVVAVSNLEAKLGIGAGAPPAAPATEPQAEGAEEGESSETTAPPAPTPVFEKPEERKVAAITLKKIRQFQKLPSSKALTQPEVHEQVVAEVQSSYNAQQEELGLEEQPDVAEVVKTTIEMHIQETIDIPRVVVVPDTEVTVVFETFELDCSSIRLQANEHTILIQDLQSNELETLETDDSKDAEPKPENYLVRCLMDYEDINYDQHADLLYDLSGQMVKHLESYLKPEEVVTVLKHAQRKLAELIYRQMMNNHREETTSYSGTVTRSFTDLIEPSFTAKEGFILNFRETPPDLSKIRQYIFIGFKKYLFDKVKFDSNSERKFSIILEDDGEVEKWFKPARNQFQIYYKSGIDEGMYQPDFVVETSSGIFLCEPKASDEMEDPVVIAKRDAAVTWCAHASEFCRENESKEWTYVLIPHDAIQTNKDLKALVDEFRCEA